MDEWARVKVIIASSQVHQDINDEKKKADKK